MHRRSKERIVRVQGATSSIELSQGKSAIVDTTDLRLLAEYGIWLSSHGYVKARKLGSSRAGKEDYFHRIIISVPSNMQIDHINRNKLDNRKCNLRVVTRRENIHNVCLLQSNNKSGFRGVSWFKLMRKWRATINVGGKQKALGYFDDPAEAAVAYDEAVREYFTIEAPTNFWKPRS